MCDARLFECEGAVCRRAGVLPLPDEVDVDGGGEEGGRRKMRVVEEVGEAQTVSSLDDDLDLDCLNVLDDPFDDVDNLLNDALTSTSETSSSSCRAEVCRTSEV